ncbi:uncharacterized protein LOC116733271 isoform X1 [Xiphophorus hellerii]|uniref:uncharacterized protein LOC116733271 isoform X1 n=1 Tax=Xiphophorus hellerii TaxID=8084 RepID=UPI0013B463E8|nr:uncharacterized protein LOC116733271 isoform X1 [Xiphophorus hellerii]
MNMFVLLTEQTEAAETADGSFPDIFPRRLQFFEYESITVQCELMEDANVWRVMREFHKSRPTNSSDPCSSPAPSCTIKPALEKHSGEYWCENDLGETSRTLSVSITAGLVILEVPVQPVAEGSEVTLGCIHQKTELHHIRDFYKDGLHLMTCYSSNMTIRNVSKADEGNYSCSISGAGESPDSRLAVHRALTGPTEETPPAQCEQNKTFSLQSAVRVVLFVLLSLVTGVILYKLRKGDKIIYIQKQNHSRRQSMSVRGGNASLTGSKPTA